MYMSAVGLPSAAGAAPGFASQPPSQQGTPRPSSEEGPFSPAAGTAAPHTSAGGGGGGGSNGGGGVGALASRSSAGLNGSAFASMPVAAAVAAATAAAVAGVAVAAPPGAGGPPPPTRTHLVGRLEDLQLLVTVMYGGGATAAAAAAGATAAHGTPTHSGAALPNLLLPPPTASPAPAAAPGPRGRAHSHAGLASSSQPLPASAHGTALLVSGPRGAGKTSLVAAAADHLVSTGAWAGAAYADLRVCSGPEEVALAIALALGVPFYAADRPASARLLGWLRRHGSRWSGPVGPGCGLVAAADRGLVLDNVDLLLGAGVRDEALEVRGGRACGRVGSYEHKEHKSVCVSVTCVCVFGDADEDLWDELTPVWAKVLCGAERVLISLSCRRHVRARGQAMPPPRRPARPQPAPPPRPPGNCTATCNPTRPCWRTAQDHCRRSRRSSRWSSTGGGGCFGCCGTLPRRRRRCGWCWCRARR